MLSLLAASLIVLSGSPPAAAGTPFSEVQQKDYFSTANAASHNLVFDSTPTQNNLLVITVTSDATVSTPSGYTLAASAVSTTGSYIFYKVAGASESATITLVPGASTSLNATGFEFSGTATASPLDKTSNVTSASSNDIIIPATTTTAQANEILVAMAGHSSTSDLPEFVSVNNSFVSQAESISTGSTVNLSLVSATRVVTSTGTFGITFNYLSGPIGNGVLATFKITTP